ncbi:hypothetical protein CPB85DRAFT_1417184 [Mucidula mucida]|nr:hypothetical protein CPB85DRAFT_1417184 [Mucidula mucida]
MGIGKTIKNILTDHPSKEDLSDRRARGSDDSGLTHSSVETASDNSPTRPSAIGGAANRHVDSVNPGGQGPTNPITPTRGNVGTERTDQPTDHLGNGHKTGGFTEQHTHGHHDKASRDLMPSAGQTHEEEMHRLDPVTHEHVRHQEVEEVVRQKEKDRHVHHVQHHSIPVTQKEEKDEVHHEKIHPMTEVHEKHANTNDDTVRLDAQVQGNKDHVYHGDKERTVLDKGTAVNEHVHHHTHHVIQPIIEKETFDRHRVHTVIPSHEEIHEAPIVHDSQQHAPISMQDFMQTYGGDSVTSGAVPHDQIGSKVMHPPDCERTVDGPGEKLAKELRLGAAEPSDVQHTNVGERNVPGRFVAGTTQDSDGVGMHNPHGRAATQNTNARQEMMAEKERVLGSHGKHEPYRGMGHYNIGHSAEGTSEKTGYEDQRAAGTNLS